MSIPHKCPVCVGSGQVPVINANQQFTTGGTYPQTQTCTSCSGSGIVWEVDFSVTPNPVNPFDGFGITSPLPYLDPTLMNEQPLKQKSIAYFINTIDHRGRITQKTYTLPNYIDLHD